MLQPHRYLDLLGVEAERLATSARSQTTAQGGLNNPVPSCPDWSVKDVVEHTAVVYLHKVELLRTGQWPKPWPPAGLDRRDPLELFADAFGQLRGELASRDADDEALTWDPTNRTVGFWYRRMAQETAVHRVDVESACGAPGPVDDDLAVDGIDELLRLFLPRWGVDADPGSDGTSVTTPTVAIWTGEHLWRVHLAEGGSVVEEGPGHAEATVTGEPSQLLLWLWGRRPDAAVVVEGDVTAVQALRERLVTATQ